MSPVVSLMTEPSDKKQYCRYTTVKFDADLLSVARIAAAMEEKKLQDWLSDLVNKVASDIAGRKPIKRKPPPPGKKRGPKTGE